MRLKLYISAWLVILFCGTVFSQNEFAGLPAEDKEFLDTLQYKTFLYFVNEINPENGLVKDRSTSSSPASMAAVGFAVPVWCIGAEHNWISRNEAADLTLKLLKFLLNSEQSADAFATGYNGFYYHFVDMQKGKRFWKCELSTIDTGLLLAGIRFAVQFFNGNNECETEIRRIAEVITERVNWNFAVIPDSAKLYPGSIAMAWDPENGMGETGWVGYNEALIMQVIAAGSGYKHAVKSYNKWLEYYEIEEPYPGCRHITFPPLFGHQYSHMFIDFRGIYDKYNRQAGFDYFENSRRAVYTQYNYFKENPKKWSGYDSLCWGLTACDGPGTKFNGNGKKYFEYEARGTSGPAKTPIDDGTIAPTAAASSIVFAPEIVLPALKSMYEKYGEKGLWGVYGFKDAFNPGLNWFASDYLGIDQGPIVIMIENYRNGFVWKHCMEDKIIRKGLTVLGFEKKD